MVRNVLFILIFIFAVVYIFDFGILTDSNIMVFKLIPMILIIILALITKANNVRKYHLFITIGLIFCAIGDYTLQWFVVGLSFFLVGHIFYITAFLSVKEQRPSIKLLGVYVLYGLIMAIIIVGGLLSKGDIVMGLAVIAYITIILLMGWTSWRTKMPLAIIGSFLFIISDTILALNKFTVDVPYSGILIMTTYYGAQLLLALSISKYSVFRNKVVQ